MAVDLSVKLDIFTYIHVINMVLLCGSLFIFCQSLASTEYELHVHDVDGLVQEWRNSIANALKLRLSCTSQSV